MDGRHDFVGSEMTSAMCPVVLELPHINWAGSHTVLFLNKIQAQY